MGQLAVPGSRQAVATSPRGLVDGVETLFFLGVAALGLRNSLFERFWPLAILIISIGECVCSKAGGGPRPQEPLLGQGRANAPLCTRVAIQVVQAMSLDAESVGLELACHREKSSRANLGPRSPGKPATARRLVAKLIDRLITRDRHHARGRLAFRDARMSAA